MIESNKDSLQEQAFVAHDELMLIGGLSIRFADIPRLIAYPVTEENEERTVRPENDAEHSYMLALASVHLAATYHPELDTGLVSQFCLVHDLPEIYAGDTPSYSLSNEERVSKEAAEAAAVKRLSTILPAYLFELLERYEIQQEPEARFVRFVDKLLPAVVHTNATEENREVFLGYYEIDTLEQLEESSLRRTLELKEQFPEFSLLQILRELTSATARQAFFPKS